jgi:hypothetical protein
MNNNQSSIALTLLQEVRLSIKNIDYIRIVRSSQSEQKNMPSSQSLMKDALHVVDDWNGEQ